MPPGLYRLDDVALEFQLSQPGPARAKLAALLDPLRENPELLTTLRTYFHSGLSRRRAAAQLHLHPNSVDYRLRKIAVRTAWTRPWRPTSPVSAPRWPPSRR
jgi:sugar diacid utilization regulator